MLGILGFLGLIVDFFLELWSKIPNHIKEQIINMIVSSFEALFRFYYRQWKDK